MTPEAFAEHFRVPRATLEKLESFSALLREWNERFNLVAESTLPDLWARHMFDSAQLFPLLPTSPFRLVDMGSGAGFPGLVLAILGAPDVHLIESIGKKADFLSLAAEKLELPGVTVHNDRIEALPPLRVDVLTARALKALPLLLRYAARHVKQDGFMLFLKGKKAEAELTEARKWATFACDKIPSQSDPSGVILKISRLQPHSQYERRAPKRNR